MMMIDQAALVAFLQTDEAAAIAGVFASGVPIEQISQVSAADGFVAIVLTDGRTRTRKVDSKGKVTGTKVNLPERLAEWVDRQ